MDDSKQTLALQYQAALQLQDWPTAETALRTLSGIDAGNATVWFNLGLVLQRQGQLNEAIAALRTALSLAPGHHNARFELASACAALEDWPNARDHFLAYVKAVPDDVAALFQLGMVFWSLGDAQQARLMLGRAHTGDHSVPVILALARAELACGMKQMAQRRLKHLEETDPDARDAIQALLSSALLEEPAIKQ